MSKIKILFNGFRHGHVNMLYNMVKSSDCAEIVGCIEENDCARAAAEQNVGAVFSDMSYEEWLETDIDAVAIGNTYGERGQTIIKALLAGKHVIADKPICTDEKELAEIEKIAAEQGLVIACMLDLRYLPQSLAAKQLLDSGELGEIRNISVNGQHSLSYDSRPTWYFEEGKHGGTINDLAIHGIDLIRMLSGREFAKIDAVRVWNAYAYKNPDFNDCAIFMAQLTNGAGVMADVSYSAPSNCPTPPTYWEFRIWCDYGMLSFNYFDSTVTLYKSGSPEPIKLQYEGKVGDYLTEFVDSIREGKSEMTENIISSTRTALLIQSVADKKA
ncbi:MAG: Gfo/Idh/MocA family oxidoreductase [Ruminococcaceae bacterium]|nr:Gfo/Idh/MocA family oxidoreductase [Oscillospiraceae bacterium]